MSTAGFLNQWENRCKSYGGGQVEQKVVREHGVIGAVVFCTGSSVEVKSKEGSPFMGISFCSWTSEECVMVSTFTRPV